MGRNRFVLQRSLFDHLKEKMKSEDSSLARAAIGDNLTEVKKLAEQGHDLGSVFQEENTLLHIAVAYRSLSVVGHLLKVAAIYVDRRNFRGWTALFIAAVFTRDLSLVRQLLDAGAWATTTSSVGVTPLDYILNWAPNLTEEHAAITRLLMEKSYVQFPVSLHLAVLSNPVIAFTLIDVGANVNERRFGGNTPLHVAVAHGKVECVQLLLKAKANINPKNEYGFTPIRLCLEGNRSLLNLLLQNGAAVDLKDENGQTLVHHAVYKDKADILTRVLEIGASVNPRDLRGDTPLHLAIKASLPNCTELVQVLINAGADVNATNCDRETPLMVACRNPADNFEIVAMLLYHDADPSIANSFGTTPFMASLGRNESLDRQELLFLYEADFDRIDYGGNSVLGLALLYESPLLPELIAVGAKLMLGEDELLNLLVRPGMFQTLWHMINHETFSWVGFDSVLTYAVFFQNTYIIRRVIVSEELPRILDNMYNLRIQRYLFEDGSLLFQYLWSLHKVVNFVLKRFNKETACEYVYILLSHGYQLDYQEAEGVFEVFGKSRLFSLCAEIDLQPSETSGHYLLPSIMFNLLPTVDSHIDHFIKRKGHYVRLRINLESIASFFAGKFAMKLQCYKTSATSIYRTIDLNLGIIEMLGHSLPSLRELCRDCIRDTVCATQKVQIYGEYRRMIRSMTSGIYRDILLFELPLYSVDKERVGSFCDRLNALSQPIEPL